MNQTAPTFTFGKHRRLRRLPRIRAMVRENEVRPCHLIAPLFVVEGSHSCEIPVASMPGISRRTIPSLCDEARRLSDLEIGGIAIFPKIDPELKDERGTLALDPDNLVCRTIRALKKVVPQLPVVADVALDPYTTHGHDGILTSDGSDVDNSPTVEALARMATVLAEAGADIVAPSDMMDGRVAAIRSALDSARCDETLIMSYAAKFASALYGPFRDAVGSARPGTQPLDKRTYQVEPANARQAIADALDDIPQGTDILMVKPAGWYLDVLSRLRARCDHPLAAYQVSGEFSMIHAAARDGLLDLATAREESLLAIRRAGADIIITYFAADYAESLA